jgi:hypothetical protein
VRLTRRTRPIDSDLFRAIPDRQSTRSTYDGRSIPAPDLRELDKATTVGGVRVRLFTEKRELEAARAEKLIRTSASRTNSRCCCCSSGTVNLCRARHAGPRRP